MREGACPSIDTVYYLNIAHTAIVHFYILKISCVYGVVQEYQNPIESWEREKSDNY